MSKPALALACAAALAAGSGCGDDGPIEVPEDVAKEAPASESFVKGLGAAVRRKPAREDDAYLRDFVTSFISMTPENELKWSFLEPEEGEFDFEEADDLVDLAQNTGKRVRGHTLVWHQQLPDWVTEEDWTRAQLAEVLRNHVRTVAEHYRGRIFEWDVVNEPLEGDGSFYPSIWYRVLGPSYLDIAFRAAREADPGAKLFLNEFDTELPGPKQRGALELARDLITRGVPIDGLGFEYHTTLAEARSKAELLTVFKEVERLGLEVAITEMDVLIPEEGAPAGALERQADAYRAAAEACVEAPNCTGMTVWGVTDKYSWKGASRRPLLFDGEGEAKPALEAVDAILRR
jgi:endo-1,4-beta-xylanase